MRRVNALMGAAVAAICGGLWMQPAEAAPVVPANAVVTAAAPSQQIQFDVALPLQNRAALTTLLTALQTTSSPSYHKFLTPAQFDARFGPSQATVASVTAALQAQGFTVAGVQGHLLKATGTAANFAKAFSAPLSSVAMKDGSVHLLARTGVVVPAALQSQGAQVVSFGRVPSLFKHARVIGAVTPKSRLGPVGPYFFTDLKQAYDYPAYRAPYTTASGATVNLDGTGVQAAILISNDVQDSDIANAFNNERFLQNGGTRIPTINRVLINGGAPYDFNASFEASLDVQQILGGAPGATVTLVNIPDLSDDNIFDGYTYIDEARQNPNDPNSPALYQVVNSSFGGCEIGDPVFNATVDDLYAQGNAEGITFSVSSGDEAGLECPDANYPVSPSRFIPSVSAPANSPHATAVGGTNLVTVSDGTLNAAYVSENAFGDPEIPYDAYNFGESVTGGYWGAGGGASTIFTKPAYQGLVNTGSSTARTLPDVGMMVGGCPGGISTQPCGPNRSAVVVFNGGGAYGVIGTSVSSPEFVSALVLYIQANGSQGDINPYLYGKAALQNAGAGSFYHRGLQGFDGRYTEATPGGGYNYLAGNGTPDVRALFGFTSVPAAGVPQTPSNP